MPATVDYEPQSNATNFPAISLGVLGLRLLGLYLLVSALESLPYVYLFLTTNKQFRETFGLTPLLLAIVGVRLLIALTLLIVARPIARLMFGKLSPVPLDAGPAAWMTIVVSGIGLALIISSFELAIHALIVLAAHVQLNVQQRTPAPIEPLELLRSLVPIAKVALGIVLFLRPRLIVKTWARHARL